jgi:hypothetical protein
MLGHHMNQETIGAHTLTERMDHLVTQDGCAVTAGERHQRMSKASLQVVHPRATTHVAAGRRIIFLSVSGFHELRHGLFM